MQDTGYLQGMGSTYHGHTDKASLGKYHIGLELLQNFMCLGKALHDTEGVGKILGVHVTAELSGGNAVIRYAEVGNELFLNSVIGAHIIYFKTRCLQMRQKS